MAIIDITTTHRAVPAGERARLAVELATLTYEAEGFAGSSVAPTVCWTFFNQAEPDAFATGVGQPAAPLYYVQITVLDGTIDTSGKQQLGDAITSALLTREAPASAADRNRVWVRFINVADGNLIVGGQSTSLSQLRALIAAGD